MATETNLNLQEPTKTVEAVATRLIDLCQKNQFIQAQQELYDPLIERIEVDGSKVTGRENTLSREAMFLDSLESIRTGISNLTVIDHYFSLVMSLEVTFKTGKEKRIDEICVYKVDNGSIVFEQFFR